MQQKGLIKYKMPIKMMKELIRQNKTKTPNQKWLCNYVQQQYGLLGKVIEVIGE